MNQSLQITDGTINLRLPKTEDISSIYQAVRESLNELKPWMDWATDTFDEGSALRWVEHASLAWEHARAFYFVIIDSKSGVYLGNCSLDNLDENQKTCNLGYWVRTSATRKGVASRAIRLAAKYAFLTAGLLRLDIVIATENKASQRAALKAGAHFVCERKNGIVVKNKVYDAVIYSIDREDVEA